MSVDVDDEFQKELITLFLQEAQEWLQQIHVALDELQQGPPANRHTKLAQTMKAGLTNLGGSAATISLSEVEQASFAALSFVEAVENPSAALSASDFLALCKQLGHIHSALTRATGVTFDADSSACTEAVPATMATSDLLAALQDLLSCQTGATEMARNITRTVIAQVEGLIQTGVTQCDTHSLRSRLIRVADAVGATGVALSDRSVDATNPKCVRASAGSVFHLPVVEGGHTLGAIAALWPLISLGVKYLTGGSATRAVRNAEARATLIAYGCSTPRLLREVQRVVQRARAALPAVHQPVWIAQSSDDYRIPDEQAQAAFDLLGSRDKRLHWTTGNGHVITVGKRHRGKRVCRH